RNDEVVLQLSLAAVVEQVDAGVDAFAAHLRVVRRPAPPLGGVAAQVVVAAARELPHPADPGAGVGAEEADAHDGGMGEWASGRVGAPDRSPHSPILPLAPSPILSAARR